MDPYIAVLHEIVTRGLNTNSYKFALWRALASLAPTTDKETSENFEARACTAVSGLLLAFRSQIPHSTRNRS